MNNVLLQPRCVVCSDLTAYTLVQSFLLHISAVILTAHLCSPMYTACIYTILPLHSSRTYITHIHHARTSPMYIHHSHTPQEAAKARQATLELARLVATCAAAGLSIPHTLDGHTLEIDPHLVATVVAQHVSTENGPLHLNNNTTYNIMHKNDNTSSRYRFPGTGEAPSDPSQEHQKGDHQQDGGISPVSCSVHWKQLQVEVDEVQGAIQGQARFLAQLRAQTCKAARIGGVGEDVTETC